MPRNLPRPQRLAPPSAAQEAAPASRTERYVLHAWILAITLVLLWALLS